MATKYTLYFSDTGKTPFDLQAYTTNGPVSPSDPTLISGASDASTTLKLWGKGLKDYGEPVFQDLIYMLENFSNSTRPINAIEGQLWYNNATIGSPPAAELFIRNNNASDVYGLVGSPPTISHPGWDAVILATGSSVMTGELILSGVPVNSDAAVPLGYVDLHIGDDTLHLTALEDSFLGGLILGGSPASLQSDDVNALIGITGNVQTLLNNKVSKDTDTLMDVGVNLYFQGTVGSPLLGGEVLGLPAVPSQDGAAASKKYVDDQIAGADSALSNVAWTNTGIGSPAPTINENTLELTVAYQGSPPILPPVTFEATGISRVGHTHNADEVPIDSTFDPSYGSDVQAAIEKAADEIDLLKTGGIPPSATITVQRQFEALTAPIIGVGSPKTIYEVQSHFADDSRVFLSVNGVKQYTNTRTSLPINYNTIIGTGTSTGLNPSETYEFDISVDGAPATTIVVNAGSPPVDISNHGLLASAINTALAGSPNIEARIRVTGGTVEVFETISSGAGHTIVITDPGGSPNLYLYDTGSPLQLSGLLSVGTSVAGIDGDYEETGPAGNSVQAAAPTSHVVFNYDIPAGSPPTKIESLLYV